CTHSFAPPEQPVAPCVLAQLGRCGAPCDGTESLDAYTTHAEATRKAMTTDPAAVVDAHIVRIGELAAELRYEEAAVHRDRLTAFLRGARSFQRLRALTAVPHLVAARRASTGWESFVLRHGRRYSGAL